MDYQNRLDEIKRRRSDLEMERNRIKEELYNLRGADDVTIKRHFELDEKLWEIHDEIMATYDEAKLIRIEMIENMFDKLDSILEGTEV